jgi:hypothetical protein
MELSEQQDELFIPVASRELASGHGRLWQKRIGGALCHFPNVRDRWCTMELRPAPTNERSQWNCICIPRTLFPGTTSIALSFETKRHLLLSFCYPASPQSS